MDNKIDDTYIRLRHGSISQISDQYAIIDYVQRLPTEVIINFFNRRYGTDNYTNYPYTVLQLDLASLLITVRIKQDVIHAQLEYCLKQYYEQP